MFSKQLVLTEWGLHLGMSVGVPPPTMINALMVHGVDSLEKLSLKCGFHEIRKEMTGSVLRPRALRLGVWKGLCGGKWTPSLRAIDPSRCVILPDRDCKSENC